MNKSAKILFDTAKSMGLSPSLLTDYGLFEIKYKGKAIYFFHGTSYLNNSLSSYLSKNKHTTRVILSENNLPNISFLLPKDEKEAIDFLGKYKKIMVKPTHGMNSVGVRLITKPDELRGLDLSESLLEKFIDGEEFRVLILNGEAVAFHKYIHDFKVVGVKRISLEKDKWDNQMIDLAIKSAKVLGLNFASVDFIKDRKGELFILEINSATGLWRFHHPDEGLSVDISALLISATLKNFDTIENK
jgi:glutathione synthase/RimK-type ligase-like ATP-grasp enzyme